MIDKENASKSTLDQYDNPEFASIYAEKILGRADTQEISAFVDLVPQGAQVLDAGCAAGRDVAILSEYGLQPIGLDLSAALINEAKNRHPNLDFIVGDFTQLEFEDESLDGVWSRAGVVHVPDEATMRKVLSEFYRVTKPGGALAIRTKARREAQDQFVVRTDKLSNEERFFNLQDPAEFEQLVRGAGYTVISSETYNEREKFEASYADPSMLRDEDWVLIYATK